MRIFEWLGKFLKFSGFDVQRCFFFINKKFFKCVVAFVENIFLNFFVVEWFMHDWKMKVATLTQLLLR